MKRLARMLLALLLCGMCLVMPAHAEDDYITGEEWLEQMEIAPACLGDAIPTMFAATGRRWIQEMRDSVSPDGDPYTQFLYHSDTVQEDLKAYTEFVLANGWEVLQTPGEAAVGTAAYTKPAADGQALTVMIFFDAQSYTFIATQQARVAWRASGWSPPLVRFEKPQGLGKPRALMGQGIAASYVRASALSMREGTYAYVPFDNIEIVRETSLDAPYDVVEYDQIMQPVSRLLRLEDKIICLSAYDEEYGLHAGLAWIDEDGSVTAQMPDPYASEWAKEHEASELTDTVGGGSLLQLADGTLLFMDQFGVMYVCAADGTSLHAIPGARAQEFVYHDGFVYFANLDDRMTHHDVYDMVNYTYEDVSYPRLYRVALDGTGLEKVTDCGVRGLASQGAYILYQNLDEPYALADAEFMETSDLYGPLYRFDAATQTHRKLGIRSDAYIPTPWGLAVWYHTFSIEPYDIQGDLVLYDYEGAPLYALDAGGKELIGDSCLDGGTLCFYSFNWAHELPWSEGDAQDDWPYLLSAVPLDGSPAQDLLGQAADEHDQWADDVWDDDQQEDVIRIGEDDISINETSVYLTSTKLQSEDIVSLTKLTNMQSLELDGIDLQRCDITPLGKLASLRWLSLRGCGITDLSPLKSLTDLQQLDLSANPAIKDFTPLSGLKRLEELTLYDMEGWSQERVAQLWEDLPGKRIYSDFGNFPRRIDGLPPEDLGKGSPWTAEGIKPLATKGADVAVDGDRIAYATWGNDGQTLRVLRRQGDGFAVEAEYAAQEEISNIVLSGETVAYLTGPTDYASPDAVCTMQIVRGGQEVYQMVLGPSAATRAPFVGPLVLLEDGRLLLADNIRALYICALDGTGLDKVTQALVGDFVFTDAVYFEALEDPIAYDQTYCWEWSEMQELAYCGVRKVFLDEDAPIWVHGNGVQGLSAWGLKIVYQDMDDAFVLPYGELPQQWLKGMLYLEDGVEEEPIPLGIAADRYCATARGVAVWYGTQEGEEHADAQKTKLVLHDYKGAPMHALDADGELAFAPCVPKDDDLWFVVEEGEEGKPGKVVRVPLDGGKAETFTIKDKK